MRLVRVILVSAALVFATLGAASGTALAYGKADGPIAQLELSGNCNNPDFAFCAPEPDGVGLGGVWLWIEIDGGPGATSGTADLAGSFCGHVRGVGGGAFAVRGEFPWEWSAAPEGEDVSFGGYDGGDGYYNVALAPGEVFSFPVTIGHYSSHPVPAVAIEVQVAPSGPTSWSLDARKPQQSHEA